jgi:muconolactone D-isomerase
VYFLVTIQTQLPADLGDEARAELLAAEAAAGSRLRRAGVIEHIWRLPGRLANVGIWSVQSAEELDAALADLPLHRWQVVRVEVLAEHPLSRLSVGEQSTPGR